MLAQFLSVGLIVLLSAMLPGPDFAIVSKNAILYSRRAGFFTSLGISSAILVHVSYCVLGLAVVISQSLLLFSIIKYIGAAYLIYLGTLSLLAKEKNTAAPKTKDSPSRKTLADWTAFKQGFYCNLLNPKATLFFLALFTVIIKPGTSWVWEIMYAIEIYLIANIWFFTLTMILSHRHIVKLLNKGEKYLEKVVGTFLLGFGIALAFVRR